MDFIGSILFPLTLLAALSCGLVAGIFLAFSNFVMRALARIAPAAGIAAMQSINVTVLNPGFFTVFFGAAILSLVLAGFAALHWPHPSSAWLLAGGSVYLLGSIIVTIAGNVPLNSRLGSLDHGKAESAAFWQIYIARWGIWNHVRTIASLLAALAFILGLPAQP